MSGVCFNNAPTNSSMRVGYLGHGLYFGGATTSLFLMLKALPSERIKKYVYVTSCRSEEMRQDFLAVAENVVRVRLPHIYCDQMSRSPNHRYWVARFFPCITFARQLIRDRIDILHVNTTVFPHVLKWVRKLTPVRIVVHVREMVPDPLRDSMARYTVKQISRWADDVVAISDNEAARFSGVPRLRVMANPFDFSSVIGTSHSFREMNGIPGDAILVGMMAQFSRRKGHLEFLEAARRVVEELGANCPVRFALFGVPDTAPSAGEGKRFWDEIQLRVRGSALVNRVSTFPYRYDIFPAIRALDVVVRPAQTADPWGRDIIESMAFGKPVVATGFSEFFVQHGRTGYLVPPNRPDLLAARILELVRNPSLRQTMGRQAVDRVRAMCDLTPYGDKVIKLYDEILSITPPCRT